MVAAPATGHMKTHRPPVTSRTRLTGRRLVLARLGWLVLVVPTLGLLLVSIPPLITVPHEDGSIEVNYDWTAGSEMVLRPTSGGPADVAGIESGAVLVAI